MTSLLLAALFAGLVAVGVTAAIERFGGRVGGLLGTLPTTVVAASLGIWAHAADDATLASAMYVVPAGMLLNALFLWLWRVLPSRLPGTTLPARLALMTAGSLSAWLVVAVGFVWGLGRLDGGLSVVRAIGFASTAAIVLVGGIACVRTTATPRGGRRVSLGTLVARGLLAGVAVGFAVWLTRVGGPVAAGVASVFPAIFLTTMVSLWLAQGEAVPAGAVGPMMLGSAAVATYALIAAWSLPALGPWIGAIVAWFGAVLTTTVPAAEWLRRRAEASSLADDRQAGLLDPGVDVVQVHRAEEPGLDCV